MPRHGIRIVRTDTGRDEYLASSMQEEQLLSLFLPCLGFSSINAFLCKIKFCEDVRKEALVHVNINPKKLPFPDRCRKSGGPKERVLRVCDRNLLLPLFSGCGGACWVVFAIASADYGQISMKSA